MPRSKKLSDINSDLDQIRNTNRSQTRNKAHSKSHSGSNQTVKINRSQTRNKAHSKSHSGSNQTVKRNIQMREKSARIEVIEKKILKKTAFVGLDVHKKTIRISMMDRDGNELVNCSIPNTEKNVAAALSGLPKKVKIVMESSSVWKALYFQLRDTMGYDVILSNPYRTKLIAESKQKTDKVDARVLADMRRGGYIAECHIPSKQRMSGRDLVRYRKNIVLHRTDLKTLICQMLGVAIYYTLIKLDQINNSMICFLGWHDTMLCIYCNYF